MRFDHVGVNVGSLDEMRDSYVGALGLEVEFEFELYQSLLTAGAATRMQPSQSPEPGVRIAFVADPEGNLIELLDRS